MPRRKITKKADPKKSVFSKYLDNKEQGAIFAKIPIEILNDFHQIVDREGLSIYKGTEIAIRMFIDFYTKQTSKTAPG